MASSVPWHQRRAHTLTARGAHAQKHTEPGAQVWALDEDIDPMDTRAAPERSALDGGETKGHSQPYTKNALDRLESWLGLKESAAGPSTPPPRHHRTTAEHGSMAEAVPKVPRRTSSTIQVMVHPVVETDTLEGIALRYGADVHTLRRSNGLWPGDAVQMREHLYIPVDSCRWRPSNATIEAVERKADGSLQGIVQAGSSAQPESVTVTQVDAKSLRFFPADRARPARGVPMNSDMGATGIDDLIQLQHMRRNRGGTQAPKPRDRPVLHKRPEPAIDPTWRPNTRTLGHKTPLKQPVSQDELIEDHLDQENAPRDTAPEPPASMRLDKLLRGPTVNPGAANWIRPIHESLPQQVPRQAGSSGRLWSDLFSGRVSIEDALHVAVDEWRHVSQRARRRNEPALPM